MLFEDTAVFMPDSIAEQLASDLAKKNHIADIKLIEKMRPDTGHLSFVFRGFDQNDNRLQIRIDLFQNTMNEWDHGLARFYGIGLDNSLDQRTFYLDWNPPCNPGMIAIRFQ